MKQFLFCAIINKTLLPFISEKFPSGHRFMQDNDPKHTSNYAIDFLRCKKVNWWKTLAESPDLNPIKNMWHGLKEFNRREVKPQTKDELVAGIIKFWDTVTVDKCQKYINHLILKVIELNCAATGY